MISELLITVLLLLFMLVIAQPLGSHIYNLFNYAQGRADSLLECVIYRFAGINPFAVHNWRSYVASLLLLNLTFVFISYLILLFQHWLPGNPNNVGSLDPLLVFNIVSSFVTNTNLQHYSGELFLSYSSQMLVITMLMFVAPATGLSSVVALFRGLAGKQLGNFFVDFVRSITRLFLPGAVIFALLFVLCGVPQTLQETNRVTTLEGEEQVIALGPVASLAAIKYLGCNGGGFFAANTAHPYETPSLFAALLQIIAMLAIVFALPFTYSKMLNKPRHGRLLFALMFVMLLFVIGFHYVTEQAGNPMLDGFDQDQGNLEGRELRFGSLFSSVYSVVSTATETGAANASFDSMTPLGGLTLMFEMIVNVIFGGIGSGFMNLLLYIFIAIFLAGLMVGRTPEYLGRKIEPSDMRIIILLLLAHPILVLVPTSLAFLIPGVEGSITNPGFHGISQVFYEFLSSSANNGSGFEGLQDNTIFWNIGTALVMLLSRYLPIALFLLLAGTVLTRGVVPETSGTFRTDNLTFALILCGSIILVGALTFLPILMLGPIAEFLEGFR